MTARFIHRCGLLALAAWISAPDALALAPLIEATIQPSQIVLGESAELTITSSGSEITPVALPQVPGLTLRLIGHTHRTEMVRGATLVSTVVVVRVTPDTAGIYTIPAITPASQPLILRVNPDDGSGRSAALGSSNSSSVHEDGIRLSPDGSAYLRLALPKREVFVGESVPVMIEVGMRNGFVTSLNGLPTLNGADFTLNNLAREPARTPKIIDGKVFTVLTWHSVLAAVKPGKFSLWAESPLTVRVQTRPARESRLEDALGDPFMQNFFGASVSKDIKVASPPTDFTVLPLPTTGRPADFSGAVGSFKISGDLSPSKAAAGDPLTLRLRVSGAGNFDRVDTAMLNHLDSWKTYPPRSSFKASDPVGFSGEKTFEQPLVAAQPGPQSLPALTFSYFNPATRRYETARSAPIAVMITAIDANAASGRPEASGAIPGAAGADAVRSSGLRPDHAVTGSSSGSLVPPYLQLRFIAVPSLLWLALAGMWFVRRRAGARSGLARRAAKTSDQVLRELEDAARTGDAARFFTIARCALLQVAGPVGEGTSEQVLKMFALADEVNYSGDQPTTTDFEGWMKVVRERLPPHRGLP